MSSQDSVAADDSETYFEGYSDYQSVSKDIGRSVADAVDAYAHIKAKHQQGDRVKVGRAAGCYEKILSAALRLAPELEREKSVRDDIKKIHEDWVGDDSENGNFGYIEKLEGLSLMSNPPDWLQTFVMQIRRAAFLLGYLQAGRMQSDDNREIDLEQTEAMFEDL